MTSFYNKYKTPEYEHPDFWVLVQIKIDSDQNFKERFFILSHTELSVIQAEHNRAYRIRCGDVTADQHLTWEDLYQLSQRSVDNVLSTDVEELEDKWNKIVNARNVAAFFIKLLQMDENQNLVGNYLLI